MTPSAKLGFQAAAYLLAHPELTDRAQPYLHEPDIDWVGLWTEPPWSTREERVLRAAAEVSTMPRLDAVPALRLAELTDSKLWDPRPFAPKGEDHSHRVLEAIAIRRGFTEEQAREWLRMRYDTIARALDIWEWGALSTDVDAGTHILTSHRLAGRARQYLFGGGWQRVFEAVDREPWDKSELIMVDAARAYARCGPGPTIRDVTALLDDEQLSIVVEGLYIAWYHGA